MLAAEHIDLSWVVYVIEFMAYMAQARHHHEIVAMCLEVINGSSLLSSPALLFREYLCRTEKTKPIVKKTKSLPGVRFKTFLLMYKIKLSTYLQLTFGSHHEYRVLWNYMCLIFSLWNDGLCECALHVTFMKHRLILSPDLPLNLCYLLILVNVTHNSAG